MNKKIILLGIVSILLLAGVLFFNKSDIVDKGSLWLEIAIDEVNKNTELDQQEKEKLIKHFNNLNDNSELRKDIKMQTSFLEEISGLNFPETSIKTLEKAHIRVSSPLNYHDGYWVAKVKPPGSPFKASVINDLHIDPYTKRATIYAQTTLFGKVIAPAQVGPGEYATDKDGNKTAHHPNSVYLNGSGQELSEADGTGEWWVKHSWVIDGEGYVNWELKPEEDYGQGTWVEGILLEDGITMKIGTLNTSNSDELWGFNTRVPKFNENKLSYEVIRWEYLDNNTGPTEIWNMEWHYKTNKSAFDNQSRKPMGE